MLHQLAAYDRSRRVVRTLGAQGVQWCDPLGHLQRMPAINAGPVVDTLGAGDVFHAALGLALAEGQAECAALRFASALKCTRPDGIAGAPTRAEVEALLTRMA